jgi:glycogen debranching enzyme
VEDAIRIADRWYVLVTSSHTDDRTRVQKYGDTFGVFDRHGDVPSVGTGVHGLYHEGTRFLSRLELRASGQRPLLLNSSVREDNGLLTADLSTPDLHDSERLIVPKGTVHVFRARLLGRGGCQEHVRVTNYGSQPVALTLTYDFAADYLDIFEVRGLERARRGQQLAPAIRPEGVVLAYLGLDGVLRRTSLIFTPTPDLIGPHEAAFALRLAPHVQRDLYVAIACEPGGPEATVDYAGALARAEALRRRDHAGRCHVRTANSQFDAWLQRSAADLAMLTAGNPEGPYPYAGVPWYSTPFGRDGILTALQCLWVEPAFARATLQFLARTQATEDEPERDAEPGKILHELRRGELASLGEIPFGRYYGSVDATPLFVVLAGAYHERTGDLELIRSIWPNIERALEWIERYGDADGDGFVEYRRRSSRGLLHQGWRDSEGAVFHGDGRPAVGPIALAEVQGYVFDARRKAAALAAALGDARRAASLLAAAEALRSRFEAAFWSDALDMYVLALDGEKRQCEVRASTAGHVLWSGIADAERARRTARALLGPAFFSGWGVRTVAEREACYNPMSYHNGSIWPHDNSLIAAGCARYGLNDEALRIVTALFDATAFLDLHRLPELYCGFVRRESEGPTQYPVACSPQAWAAGSVFLLLQACLAISFEPGKGRVVFTAPLLPDCLDRLEIRNLGVGNGRLDLAVRRHERGAEVTVLRSEGEVELAVL